MLLICGKGFKEKSRVRGKKVTGWGMVASVSSEQDGEALVRGREWHSRPGNSMCEGSEARKKCTLSKNGQKAEVLKCGPGV